MQALPRLPLDRIGRTMRLPNRDRKPQAGEDIRHYIDRVLYVVLDPPASKKDPAVAVEKALQEAP